MKVFVGLVAIIFALGGSLLAYDNSPRQMLVFPEVIWAQATGGGTWASELQITNMTAGNILKADFIYGAGLRRSTTLTNSSAVQYPPAMYPSVKISNILATMQSLDRAFAYYGRVGCLKVLYAGSRP